MKTSASIISRLMKWFKKHMEGEWLLQWIIYIMLFIALTLFITDHPPEMPKWRFYGTILALTLLLVLNILWQNWENVNPAQCARPFNRWAFMLVSGMLLLAAFWMGELYDAIFLVFMLCSQGTILLGLWPAGVIYCLINMAAWLAVFYIMTGDPGTLASFAVSLGVGILFVSLLTILLDRYSRQTQRAEGLLKELQAANKELKAAQQKEKELAIAEERMRLARDIHDGLGHHLTVLSIQLQAADKLVERNPQAAAEAIRASRQVAQAALEEVRRSVGMMRQPASQSQPLEAMLASLVHDFGEHTRLETSFEHTGDPVDLSPFAGQTLFRVVQESLTNVQKHGVGVKHILVRLEYSPASIHLAVRDDGQKPGADSTAQTGYGLKGLQERVDQLGGRLSCGPGAESGFEVSVTIPLKEVIHDQSASGG
jgi:signal transduction histidine kinase